ncbi:MAG: glycosyltransferase family 2 protein [Bacteroidota bacterium]
MKEQAKSPLVSVLMITYNRANYLEESINSVLYQTYSNLEIVVLDDGSTDDTQVVIKRISDERLKYHRINHIGLISKVRNESLKLASGEYIAFIDSDDLWQKNKLETQLGFIFQHRIDAIFSNITTFDVHGNTDSLNYSSLTIESTSEQILRRILEKGMAIYVSTLLMNKSVLDKIGAFSERLSATEMEFMSRLIAGCEVRCLPENLVRIRKHEVNSSSVIDVEEKFEEKFMILRYFHLNGILGTKAYEKSMLMHYGYLMGNRFPKFSFKIFFRYYYKTIRLNPFSLVPYKAFVRKFLRL